MLSCSVVNNTLFTPTLQDLWLWLSLTITVPCPIIIQVQIVPGGILNNGWKTNGEEQDIYVQHWIALTFDTQ